MNKEKRENRLYLSSAEWKSLFRDLYSNVDTNICSRDMYNNKCDIIPDGYIKFTIYPSNAKKFIGGLSFTKRKNYLKQIKQTFDIDNTKPVRIKAKPLGLGWILIEKAINLTRHK